MFTLKQKPIVTSVDISCYYYLFYVSWFLSNLQLEGKTNAISLCAVICGTCSQF